MTYQVEESIINVVYCPLTGASMPDGCIDYFCDIIEKLGRFRFDDGDLPVSENVGHTTIVGSLLIVDELRARMVEGRLKIDKMIYRYTDKETNTTKDINLKIDENAKIEFWPEGFCDYNEKSLMRILGLKTK
jgi:hypothetical protein